MTVTEKEPDKENLAGKGDRKLKGRHGHASSDSGEGVAVVAES